MCVDWTEIISQTIGSGIGGVVGALVGALAAFYFSKSLLRGEQAQAAAREAKLWRQQQLRERVSVQRRLIETMKGTRWSQEDINSPLEVQRLVRDAFGSEELAKLAREGVRLRRRPPTNELDEDLLDRFFLEAAKLADSTADDAGLGVPFRPWVPGAGRVAG